MISTHVLDTSIGKPAAGVRVAFSRRDDAGWEELVHASTDANGRISLAVSPPLPAGTYRLAFDVGSYFRERDLESFYTIISVEFVVRDASSHHHVPLLVSPYGYSTYRGS